MEKQKKLFLTNNSCVIDEKAEINKNCIIGPNVIIKGKCKICKGCVISDSVIEDSIIEEYCNIKSSTIENSFVEPKCEIGPYSHIRDSSYIEYGCRIGNFVEIKKSKIGNGTKIAHLAYVGNAILGKMCNIGCGCIFVNYNGEKKFSTQVGDYAFLGSNCNIIAPVKLGKGCYIAAGTTICENVNEFEFCIGREKQKGVVDKKNLYYFNCLKKQNKFKKLFGTDGVRGIVGEMINEKLMKSIAFALTKLCSSNSKIAIARDTRTSGEALVDAFINTFLHINNKKCAVVDYGVVSTPALSFVTQVNQFDFGVMVTASHNSSLYNGVKIFNNKGEKIDNELEHLIELLIDDFKDCETGDEPFSCEKKTIDNYLTILQKSKHYEKNKFKILFDMANGATTEIVKEVFKNENCVFVNANIKDDINKNSGCLDDEILVKNTKKYSCDIAFAFDGDGDRIKICDKNGVIYDGDKILYLLSIYYFEKYNIKSGVCFTIQSNMALKNALEERGIACYITDVGDKNVYMTMKQNSCELGGESSGHIIIKKHSPSGDGIWCAIEVLNALNFFNKEIGECKFYSEYYKIEKSYESQDKNEMVTLLNQKYKDLIDECACGGRILIRPSGTENKIRILVENVDEKKCNENFVKIHTALLNEIEKYS